MRSVFKKVIGASLLIAAAVFVSPAAMAQLATGVYKVPNDQIWRSNPNHNDIKIIVQGSSFSRPGFTFAATRPNERLVCDQPLLLPVNSSAANVDSMSCTKVVADGNQLILEIITIGKLGGNFCDLLAGQGGKVVTNAQCSGNNHTDCLCFRVEHYCPDQANPPTKPYEKLLDTPLKKDNSCGNPGLAPSRGTGSGGTP